MTDTTENTNCYTYKVEMIVQILAEDEPKAAEQLEKSGGYVTSRKVALMDSIPLFNGNAKEENAQFIFSNLGYNRLMGILMDMIFAVIVSVGILMLINKI